MTRNGPRGEPRGGRPQGSGGRLVSRREELCRLQREALVDSLGRERRRLATQRGSYRAAPLLDHGKRRTTTKEAEMGRGGEGEVARQGERRL